MTVNRVSDTSEVNKLNLLTIALVATFAIAAFFLTHPTTTSKSISPVAGLMTLKASAQQATPYEAAIASGKPVLLEFYADWCTTCQALAPTVASVHQQFSSDVNLVMLNIDDPQWQHQIQQFQVTGVPHLVLLEAQGAIADTFVGKVPQSVLTESLQKLL